jgi:hypothetical protein
MAVAPPPPEEQSLLEPATKPCDTSREVQLCQRGAGSPPTAVFRLVLMGLAPTASTCATSMPTTASWCSSSSDLSASPCNSAAVTAGVTLLWRGSLPRAPAYLLLLFPAARALASRRWVSAARKESAAPPPTWFAPASTTQQGVRREGKWGGCPNSPTVGHGDWRSRVFSFFIISEIRNWIRWLHVFLDWNFLADSLKSGVVLWRKPTMAASMEPDPVELGTACLSSAGSHTTLPQPAAWVRRGSCVQQLLRQHMWERRWEKAWGWEVVSCTIALWMYIPLMGLLAMFRSEKASDNLATVCVCWKIQYRYRF